MYYYVTLLLFLFACNNSESQKINNEDKNKKTTNNIQNSVEEEKPIVQDSLKFEFEVIGEIYHNPSFYTQGYVYKNNFLYESIGQYGESAIHKIDIKTGQSLKSENVGLRYFGEGIEIFNNKIYLLTWREQVCKVFDLNSFSEVGEMFYDGEGWGLCAINGLFYMSDGSDKIQIKEPNSFKTIDEFSLMGEDNLPLNDINELEYAKGYIFANIWMTNKIAVIDPVRKSLVRIMDFSVLRKKLKNNPKAEAFNGIAYNPDEDIFYLTGKNWNTTFKVRIY